MDIKKYVMEYEVSQRMMYTAITPMGLLQLLLIPSQIWEDLSMDFIMGLPKINGVDTILVVVDNLSKYAHFLLVKHPFTTKDIVRIFICEVAWLHRFPCTIVIDRDCVFMSRF